MATGLQSSGDGINYRPQTKFAKIMFLHLSVSHSVNRWGGCLAPGPGGRLGVWPVSSPRPGGAGPGGCLSQHALRETPPPPADGYCCGRYASYWNAFLLLGLFVIVKCTFLQPANEVAGR